MDQQPMYRLLPRCKYLSGLEENEYRSSGVAEWIPFRFSIADGRQCLPFALSSNREIFCYRRKRLFTLNFLALLEPLNAEPKI